MPSETTPLISCPVKRGVFVAAGPDDIRSPCPLINALANHGYIPRSGKDIHANELQAAVGEAGVSNAICAVMANAVVNEYQDPKKAYLRKPQGFFARLWNLIRNPWSLFAIFGVRPTGQTDSKGRRYINLNQLAIHGVIEHDISLSRRDFHQKAGQEVLQPEFIESLLSKSKDKKNLTIEEFADFRRERIQQQFDDNPSLQYGSQQHTVACAEMGLILGLFGDGKSVPCSYIRAFFLEERFPYQEGWKKRWWWTMGFLEVAKTAMKVKKAIGLDV